MSRIVLIVCILLTTLLPFNVLASELQSVLQLNRHAVEKASRKTVTPVLEALIETELPAVQEFLEKWRGKKVWVRKIDGLFFYVEDSQASPLKLIDLSSGAAVGTATKSELKNLKPNSGVRSLIAGALVRFQLIAKDPNLRIEALAAIERGPEANHLEILRATLEKEADPQIKERIQRLERLLTIQFGVSSVKRVDAIESFAGDTNVDIRGALNSILKSRIAVGATLPEGRNIAKRLKIGVDLDADAAYQLLIDKKLAPPVVSNKARDDALVKNIVDGKVMGTAVENLNTEESRTQAYRALAAKGDVPPFLTDDDRAQSIERNVFYEEFLEKDPLITGAARDVIDGINNKVAIFGLIDLGLDGLSLASIYFLAAIGLAITFGVMGVINMAHGEFIMIGAYTGYLVQQFIPNYTVSIIVALPLAFVVAFLAGVLLERLVIRHLMHRPLETLLATFGISIALQQLAKNFFGTQARPFTSPQWLDGAWVVNDVISISYIRIAIFILALAFLTLLLLVLNKTRLGLEVRAVTQNPRMASSMGINPDRINMLTFGLGSGIAGIAGVAIGLFGQVTSELGSGYIVQSFMTVVVGGVGNIWGTLAGAGMIGGLQKIIEFFNPSNTLAAQTYMIIFIIIFIQFKPRGIVALRGRAAGD